MTKTIIKTAYIGEQEHELKFNKDTAMLDNEKITIIPSKRGYLFYKIKEQEYVCWDFEPSIEDLERILKHENIKPTEKYEPGQVKINNSYYDPDDFEEYYDKYVKLRPVRFVNGDESVRLFHQNKHRMGIPDPRNLKLKRFNKELHAACAEESISNQEILFGITGCNKGEVCVEFDGPIKEENGRLVLDNLYSMWGGNSLLYVYSITQHNNEIEYFQEPMNHDCLGLEEEITREGEVTKIRISKGINKLMNAISNFQHQFKNGLGQFDLNHFLYEAYEKLISRMAEKIEIKNPWDKIKNELKKGITNKLYDSFTRFKKEWSRYRAYQPFKPILKKAYQLMELSPDKLSKEDVKFIIKNSINSKRYKDFYLVLLGEKSPQSLIYESNLKKDYKGKYDEWVGEALEELFKTLIIEYDEKDEEIIKNLNTISKGLFKTGVIEKLNTEEIKKIVEIAGNEQEYRFINNLLQYKQFKKPVIEKTCELLNNKGTDNNCLTSIIINNKKELLKNHPTAIINYWDWALKNKTLNLTRDLEKIKSLENEETYKKVINKTMKFLISKGEDEKANNVYLKNKKYVSKKMINKTNSAARIKHFVKKIEMKNHQEIKKELKNFLENNPLKEGSFELLWSNLVLLYINKQADRIGDLIRQKNEFKKINLYSRTTND